MKRYPIGIVTVCLALCGLLLGCSARGSGKTAAGARYPDRFVQRTVVDYQSRPFLRIACEYIGRKPYAGYPTDEPWTTQEIDFYNIMFENLSRHKITFISKKVYQKNAGHDRNAMADSKIVLIEFADFTQQPDSDFDRLEPLEERKLINQAFKANHTLANNFASIVFQIHYQDHNYTFNIQLPNTR